MFNNFYDGDDNTNKNDKPSDRDEKPNMKCKF